MAAVTALNSSVLVLNKFFMAVHVVSARKAFALLWKACAEVVHVNDDRYDFYNFDSWRELSQLRDQFPEDDGEWVRAVSFSIRVPRIIRLLIYDNMPKQTVKLNRRNIFARDENHCQYCGKRFPTSELSLDHVIPRARGGAADWKNLVCACTTCNKRKGGRTPRQAHMRLIRPPVKPKRSPLIRLKLRSRKYESWRQFLENAYWSVTLE